MRISDWSSDVCSSDLATTGLLPAGANEREKAGTVAMLQKNIKVVPQQDNIFEITSSIAIGSLSDADNAKLASGVLDSLITVVRDAQLRGGRSEEPTSELQSLMRIAYAVFCLTQKKNTA